MAVVLRQSTQIKVRVGPFVDVGDGFTPETGITLGSADEAELLKEDGAATVSLAAATWAAITGADGWYDLTLTTSHTDTVGELVVVVQDDSVCLPVHKTFQVVEEATYDLLYAAGATPVADVNAEVDTALSDYDAPTKAELDSGLAALNDPTAASIADAVLDEALSGHVTAGTLGKAVADIETDAAAILADTADMQPKLGSPAGADMSADIAAVKVDTAATLVDTAEIGTAGAGLTNVTIAGAASGAITATSIAADAIGASELAADAVNEIVDAVWRELIADHDSVTGSVAEQLSAAGSAGDPWSTALPGAYGAGTAGKLVGDNIDAPISTVDTVVDAIKAVTDNLPDSGALSSLATAAALATVDTNVDAVLVDTNELQTDDVPGLIAALNDIAVADILTTAMTESYSAAGGTMTVAQALHQIVSMLQEKATASTTLTAKKLDGSTTAMTLTLNDADAPTSITRAT